MSQLGIDWRTDHRAKNPEALQARFEAFHEENPHVFTTLRRLALEWRAVHGPMSKVGIATLFEVARWQVQMATVGDEWKLNNSYRSRYARMLMREPGLADLFEVRELRS